jgi:putative selenate reductase
VEVCPNRANVAIKVPGLDKKQVIHVDYMCNECGNCLTFCPYDSSPYLSKFTLFANEADFAASKNQGFTVLDKNSLQCKIRLDGKEFTWKKGDSISDENIASLIEAVVTSYDHLLI